MSVPKIIGRCIYCGTKRPPLHREHIIALGLNGDRILHKASCDKCADKTKKIENYVLRTMFGVYRTVAGMRTRRPKERPKEHPIRATPKGGTEQTIKIPTTEMPVALMLPRLPVARYLRGLPDDNSPIDVAWYCTEEPERIDALVRKLAMPEGSSLHLGECNPSRFSQMLGKIAHAAAVDAYGFDEFEPLAVDLALGKTESINYLVGSPADNPVPPKEDEWHSINFRTNIDTRVMVVEVRLFANLGAPCYHVVVGVAKERLYRTLVKRHFERG